jgi:hypothetical protein
MPRPRLQNIRGGGMMARPTFGLDIDCLKCGEIHAATDDCRLREIDGRVWVHRANLWRGKQATGLEFTSDDLCKAIGRPYQSTLIGELFRDWQSMGYIREVRITTTKRRARHNGTLRVWVLL